MARRSRPDWRSTGPNCFDLALDVLTYACMAALLVCVVGIFLS